jgi:serine phosphatase RsbU (regulator of sigma subunit)/PAS domain-containing protein
MVSRPGGLGVAEAALDPLPAGVALIELDTARVLYANRAAQRLGGAPGELARRLADRETFEDVRLQLTTPGGVRDVRVAGSLSRLADGTDVGMLTLEDVTEVEVALRRSRMLAEAAGGIADSLDLTETLAAVGRITVPAYADWCFVELLRADGAIDRVLIQHRDPGKQGFVEEYDRRYPLDPDAPIGSAAVIRTGEPELIPELTEEMLAAVAADPEQLRLLASAGFRSSVIVPLRVRGTVIGDLALVHAESGRIYDESDIPVVQQLADRCALAIDNARLHNAARRTRDELQTMLGGVADAVTAQDPTGRLVYANPAALAVLGYESVEAVMAAPVADLVGKFEYTDELGRPLPVERLPGRQALMGVAAPEPVVVRHRTAPDGELRWARVQATPVLDESGAPRLAINVIEDITDLKRAELGYRFLAEASRVLSGSLDYEGTLRTVADLAVPHVADWCGVDVIEGDEISRVAVAHVDPARVELAREFQRRYPPEPDSLIHQVIATGRSQVIREITDEMIVGAAIDDEHLRVIRELGMRSVMVVPMTLRDRVLGAISFVSAEAARLFDAQDLALAEDLALRAAVAIDNARLYEASRTIAQTLQASLLPPHLPELPGAELAAVYRPATSGLDVGGDFYDVFNLAEDQWYLVVGDVCGKGAEAAAITALARYTIRAAAVRRRSPSAILRWLNDAMLTQDTDGRFCTIACAHLDLSRTPARLTVCCGGHPCPLVLRAGGEVEEIGAPGTLLGMVEDPELQDRSVDLGPGDAMVAYTDGLTDAAAPARTWSPQDIAAALAAQHGRNAVAIAQRVVDAAIGDVASPRDDVALLALRMDA